MTKNTKTKAKAPAQAKAISEIAQPVAPKSKQPAKARAKAAAAPAKPEVVKPAQPVKPVVAPIPAQPKVRLEFSKPGAQSVAVAGSFNSWQPEQASTTGNGGWVKELSVGPGRYEYMFVVDGQWVADPNAKEFAPNPFGGQNSVLIVSQ